MKKKPWAENPRINHQSMMFLGFESIFCKLRTDGVPGVEKNRIVADSEDGKSIVSTVDGRFRDPEALMLGLRPNHRDSVRQQVREADALS
jgi:hypothetical protein